MNKVEKKELIDLITRIRKDFDMTVGLHRNAGSEG